MQTTNKIFAKKPEKRPLLLLTMGDKEDIGENLVRARRCRVLGFAHSKMTSDFRVRMMEGSSDSWRDGREI
jgi:hypothetical protein